MRCIIEDGVDWANMEEVSLVGGAVRKVPVDDKCERCWRRKQAFPHMDWREFASSLASADSKVARDCAYVERILDGHARASWDLESGSEGDEIGSEITRSFLVLNERELKNACGNTAKLPKSELDHLPFILVGAEDKPGGVEPAYLFTGPTVHTVAGL